MRYFRYLGFPKCSSLLNLLATSAELNLVICSFTALCNIVLRCCKSVIHYLMSSAFKASMFERTASWLIVAESLILSPWRFNSGFSFSHCLAVDPNTIRFNASASVAYIQAYLSVRKEYLLSTWFFTASVWSTLYRPLWKRGLHAILRIKVTWNMWCVSR